MNTKFKRHQSVKILRAPSREYIEYHNEDDKNFKEEPITPGMQGKINILLPNGKYHVEIYNKKGNILAYAPFDEEDLEEL
jgi:hypothetical protein